MVEQKADSVKQSIGEAPTGGAAAETAKQQDQSTHQAVTAITSSSVSVFKIPSNLPNPTNLTMEISDSDSYESSQDGGFQKVKRTRRSKTKK